MRKEQKESETHRDGLPLPARFWAILAIALGLSVSVLDVTIVNVALPTIAMVYLGRHHAQVQLLS